ncbi:D-alanyl-D-alanine carboxypeptidase/D-alanyl-D-alanine-endopeptidase [Solwaraspora sp. WMMD406]|uniref:D-alanyl-D-alanine carboxypeptidase/D-alanyl-D-alanine endopeptidase n=1 Tax=Solwaraspora sp. WMMD406 TaxID=3016095 RepID=UPI002415AA15|nr:D-alanyl-D-alanine carboxypeptidase/D-alanyl-D-alanine-endopeptidase [Solwaraspora sp. WMMD406]MDG4768474.1 D-alanyl-D-alanine carboxypeptidase/D-alanyl-D-alanine-endopeptidase [Solwaraspora sp. WMMD406]
MLVALVTAALLLLGGTTVVVLRPGPVADWLGAAPASPSPSPSVEPTPGPVLAGFATDAPMPSPAQLADVLPQVLAASGLGSRVHVSVRDVATGTVLFGAGPTVPTMPASTTKLVTAVTALAAVGPAHRIATRVVAGAAPGEVVLVGGGDPTLGINETAFYPGAARLDELAASTRAALGDVAPTKVTIDATLFTGPAFGPGWDDDIPTGGYAAAITALMVDGGRSNPTAGKGWAQRSSAPDLAAGRAFARALGLPPEAVTAAPAGYTDQLAGPTADPSGGTGPVAGAPGQNPTGNPAPGGSATADPSGGPDTVRPGLELARVESPPMVSLVEVMLADSDNVVAEALARQVAIARGEPASFAGAAAAMDTVLAEIGLDADQSDLRDGSGLSRLNRVSPALLTELIVLAGGGSRPELTSIFSGLPVAGWSGTLQGRYRGSADPDQAGAGMIRAKTGSLSGVNSLAGTVTTADGRLLAFAVLADAVPLYIDAAQAALDRIAGTLATCGCR